ncbi:MAG: ABC transporter permease [Bacillota bacterium]
MTSLLKVLLSVDFGYASIRMASPLILAALGGIFSERAGVLSLGLEGMMLSGALAGFLGSFYSGSPWVGVVYAGLAGGAVAVIYAAACITFKANQVVAAVGLNILAQGITGLVFRGAFGITQDLHQAPAFKPVAIPVLSKIPVLGPMLFNHEFLVYAAFLLLPVVVFVLYRTTWGLKLRSVGENPLAADTVGVNVTRMRYTGVVISGILAGIAGSLLSIAFINTFIENITAGRGFVAFAAVIFGKWTPIGVFLSALLFGAADALQLRIQALGLPIPYQLMLLFPYLLALIALVFSGRSQSPASLGRPYEKSGQS